MIWLIIFIFFIVLIIYLIIYTDTYRYMYIEDYDLYKLDRKYKFKKRLKNCVITLTTTPNRISKIRPTLTSLLDQSLAVDEIRLNVPYYSSKGEKYRIPKWLKRLKSVKIYRIDKDWGPATKLIPTLLDKQNEHKKIIVVDDDVVYGYLTVETLNNYFEKYLGKRAVTIYGDLMDHKENTIPVRAYNYIRGELSTELLRGHSGYMVKKWMFPKEVYDYSNAPKEAFFVDDNWFSNHLRRNGVKILEIGINYKAIPIPDWVACHEDGLHPNHNNDGHNERVVNRYFKND